LISVPLRFTIFGFADICALRDIYEALISPLANIAKRGKANIGEAKYHEAQRSK